MQFTRWLDTFLAEKGIEADDVVEATGASGVNTIPVGCLVQLMANAPRNEQQGIRYALTRIDFVAPGRKPVLDYFAHLAQAVAI